MPPIPQNKKPQGSVIDKLRTGSEWTPGHPASRPNRKKHEVEQPPTAIVSKVADLLFGYFEREQPPADNIMIVPDSLRLVDPLHNVWIAGVQTMMHFTGIGARVHVSRVRFRIAVKSGSLSIHHNHVIFV